MELVPSRDEQNWIQNILPDSIRNLIRGSNLIRAEDQIEQKYLNWEERHSRRYNLFEVRSNASIVSDSVLLVDDVMSTGTSLESCVSLLLRLGYRRVYIVVFAYQSRISEENMGLSDDELERRLRGDDSKIKEEQEVFRRIRDYIREHPWC